MVERRIGELERLELLVNNAGYGISGRFYKSDIQRQLEMIQVHVIASVRLARAALPQMVERGNGGHHQCVVHCRPLCLPLA